MKRTLSLAMGAVLGMVAGYFLTDRVAAIVLGIMYPYQLSRSGGVSAPSFPAPSALIELIGALIGAAIGLIAAWHTTSHGTAQSTSPRPISRPANGPWETTDGNNDDLRRHP